MEIIEITGVGSQLQGVGRLRDGRAAFVPFVIPGERVSIEIARDGGRFVEARLQEVLSPAAERVAPDCPVYGLCGGCQARHMTYAASLAWKRRRVADALERLGGFERPNVLETVGIDNPLRARNKAEYAIVGGKIGAFRAGSRELVPLCDCLLQQESSVQALRALSAMDLRGLCFAVTRVNRMGEMMLVLSGTAPISPIRAFPGAHSLYYCRLNPRPAHALDGTCRWIAGAKRLEETFLGLRFSLLPQSFFQVNVAQAERMVSLALSALDLSGAHTVLDAYCGAGTITLAAAARARLAVGVEIVEPAILDARASAERNGLAEKSRFVLGDAAREIPRLISNGLRFEAAILDPPRKGAEERVLAAIANAAPAKIAYISCDPATLARDLKYLRARGYALEWAQPFDMFAYTGHVETVALLRRANDIPA